MDTSHIDDLARSVISSAGHSENFGHGLGHGIGLEPHENPRLGPKSEGTIQDEMVFTVEPGIYLPGWGGIRIEDTVAMHNGKLMQLTNISKEARVQGG
jgi:Xaa-Pro aminopeptidase